MSESEQKPAETSENQAVIDKDKILTTQKRRLLYNWLIQGLSIKEAAQKARMNYRYARTLAGNMGTNPGINALVRQETAIIEQETAKKLGITVEFCQAKLRELAKTATDKGKEGVARACYADLLKTIGGFQADAPNPKALLAKDIDKDKAKALAAAADWYYRRKYLAVEPDNIVDISLDEAETKDNGHVDGQGQDGLSA